MMAGWALELAWMIRRESLLCPSGNCPHLTGHLAHVPVMQAARADHLDYLQKRPIMKELG